MNSGAAIKFYEYCLENGAPASATESR